MEVEDIMSEEILGIFSGWMDKGGKIFRNIWWCKLVFTTNRIIVAKGKKAIIGVLGGGTPDYIFSQASTRKKMIMQEISAQEIEDTLKADAENFEIPYSDITVVEAKPCTGPDYVYLLIYMGSLHAPKYSLAAKLSRRYFSSLQTLLETVLPGKL